MSEQWCSSHRRPAQTNRFERSVQRAPQIAPGCSVQRRRPRLTLGMGSLMDEGGRPCHACHRILQRVAPAASHASVAMPARGQHEGCQHERWAPLSQRLAGRGHAGRPVAPRLSGRTHSAKAGRGVLQCRRTLTSFAYRKCLLQRVLRRKHANFRTFRILQQSSLAQHWARDWRRTFRNWASCGHSYYQV